MGAQDTIGASLLTLDRLLTAARRELRDVDSGGGGAVTAPAPRRSVAHETTAAAAAKLLQHRTPPSHSTTGILEKIQAELRLQSAAQPVAAPRTAIAASTVGKSRDASQAQPGRGQAGLAAVPASAKAKLVPVAREGRAGDIFERLYNRGMRDMRRRADAAPEAPSAQVPKGVIPSSSDGRHAPGSSGAPSSTPAVQQLHQRHRGQRRPIWERLHGAAHQPQPQGQQQRGAHTTVHRLPYSQHHSAVQRPPPPRQEGGTSVAAAPRAKPAPPRFVERLLDAERRKEERLEQLRRERDQHIRLLASSHGHAHHLPANRAGLHGVQQRATPNMRGEGCSASNNSHRLRGATPNHAAGGRLATPDGAWSRAATPAGKPILGSTRGDAQGAAAVSFRDAPRDEIEYHINDSFEVPLDEDLANSLTPRSASAEREPSFQRPVVAPLRLDKLRRR